jgi:hypothetical protein
MTTEKWTREIDLVTDAFKREFGTLSATQLNWKPNANTWSVAQILDHLIVINRTYDPILKDAREKKLKLPFISKIGFMVSFFGNVILKSVQPEQKRKTKTFPIWEPSTSAIDGDILIRFENHQAEFKELIRNSADLLESGTIIHSPANKNIVYTLEAAFDIMVTHEKRHLEQARRLKPLVVA